MFPGGVISFTAGYIHNNNVMYISSNDINALYSVDMITKEVNYLGAFMNRDVIDKFYHVHVEDCIGKLFFIDRFSLKIDSYDIENKMFSTIFFPEEFVKHYQSWKIVSDKERIFFISNIIGQGMIVFDMHSETFNKCENWLRKCETVEKFFLVDGNPLCYNRSKTYTDGILRVHVRETDLIAEYDTVNDCMLYKLVPRNLKGNVKQVQYWYGQYVMLANNTEVVFCDDDLEVLERIPILRNCGFIQFIYEDSGIYYIDEDSIYYLNRKLRNSSFQKIYDFDHDMLGYKEFYPHYTDLGIWLNFAKTDMHLLLKNGQIMRKEDIRYPQYEDLSWYWSHYDE